MQAFVRYSAAQPQTTSKMNNKPLTTLVLGATTNPSRYAHIATRRLLSAGHPVVLVGIREGSIEGHPIRLGQPIIEEKIDTVTLYVGPQHQPSYYDFLLGLSPRRIIFNPGTESPELVRLAQEKGIATEQACTLVLLSTGGY